MSKRLLLLLTLFSLPFYNVKLEGAFYPESTFFTQDPSFFLHTIERGQTVYSISVMYNVPMDEIYRLNPASKTVIRAGDVLKIPQESSSYLYHTILPKETLYGLAQKYYMKGEDIIAANPGLSVATFLIGKTIRIPTNLVTTPIEGGNETANSNKTNSLLSQVRPAREVNGIKIALLLSFGLKENTQTKAKMAEYLEGFLLAIGDMKKKGVSVHLQVYDIGSDTKKISNLLKDKKLQDIHLLISGGSDEQIKLLSRFSKENDIPYLIPFSSQSDEPFSNPRIFQVNTPQPYLYSKASYAFINKYGRDNIIIASNGTDTSGKNDFINLIKQDLQEKNIPYKTVTLGANFFKDLQPLLSNSQKNVILPSDDSRETLSKLTPALKSIVESQPNLSLSLFGYPQWQTYTDTYSDVFFRLNTTFYTLFYSDPTALDVRVFYSNFYKKFSRLLIETFPKFGMLGYDTGMYFIQLVHTYGSQFSDRINDTRYDGVQTDFYFERLNNWSGFINTSMYFINYNSDYSITKNLIK